MTHDATTFLTATQLVEAIREQQLFAEENEHGRQKALEPLNAERRELTQRAAAIASGFDENTSAAMAQVEVLSEQLLALQESCPHAGQAVNKTLVGYAFEYILQDERRLNLHSSELGMPSTSTSGQCADCLQEDLIVCPVCQGLAVLKDLIVGSRELRIYWMREIPRRSSQQIQVDQEVVDLFGLKVKPKTLDDFLQATMSCQIVSWFKGQPSCPSETEVQPFLSLGGYSGVDFWIMDMSCPKCSVKMVDVNMTPHITWTMP